MPAGRSASSAPTAAASPACSRCSRGELHAESRRPSSCPRPGASPASPRKPPPCPTAALDFVLDGDVELRRVERELAAAEAPATARRSAICTPATAKSTAIRPRRASPRCCTASALPTPTSARPVAEFSGGWRVRLNLARALILPRRPAAARRADQPPRPRRRALAGGLAEELSPATLLLISHDRDFLDAVVGQILPSTSQRLSLTSGSYSDLRARPRRAPRHAAGQPSKRSSAKSPTCSRFIERFRAKATKARQAQSRIKALERMEIDRRRPRRFALPFRLPPADRACPTRC